MVAVVVKRGAGIMATGRRPLFGIEIGKGGTEAP
jgi:hypothetical protein